jgi:hypothetical protein
MGFMINTRFTLSVGLTVFCLAVGLLVACKPRITPTASLSTHTPAPTLNTRSPVPTPDGGSPSHLPTAARLRLYLPLTMKGDVPPTPTRVPPALAPATPVRTPIPTSIIPTTDIPINLGGLHVEGVGDHTGYEEFLRACSAANRPVALIKVYGDGYSAKLAKTIDPRTVTIWRKPAKVGHDDYMDNPPDDWTWPENETADRARRWLQAMYPEWVNQRDFIDYFEIVNEPNPATITQTLRAADFMLEAMKEADRQNPPYHLAIWSFSSGTPEPWQAELMVPSLRYAAEHGHILAVHDGSVDAERPLFRQAYQDGTALRYRMFQPLLGSQMPRVAVTEAYQLGGHLRPDWFDWQWYLTELAKDNVIGAAWFTLGIYSFDGKTDVNVVAQLSSFAKTLGCR